MNKKLFGFVFVFILVFTFFTKISFAGNPPTITSFSPASGNVGDLIKIFGDNLTPVDTIFFGTKEAYLMDIHPISTKEIEVFVPNDAVTGKIKVKTTSGEAISTNAFEVSSNTPKLAHIINFNPMEGKIGDEVVINGENLNGISGILFNEVEAVPGENDGSTFVKVKVPTGATSGKITIKTSNGDTESSESFTVLSDTDDKVITKTNSNGLQDDPDVNINGKKVVFNGLVPDCNTGAVNANGEFENPCDFNYFMALINKIIKFLLFTIATPLVALIIMYTGWLFISAGGSAGQTEKAKHILFNVVIGYIIALAAWLLINAILSIFEIPSDSAIYSFLKK